MKALSVLFSLVFLASCSTFGTVGYADLPDGTTLKAMKFQADTVHGSDLTYTIVYRCNQDRSACEKAGEASSSSAAFLKSMFGGAAAGAAIGAGIALQDYEGTSVNQAQDVKGVSKSDSGAAAVSVSGATAIQSQRTNVDLKQQQQTGPFSNQNQ